MRVKILGIVGTPIKNGNCQYIAQVALKTAEDTGDVETEVIHLKDYNIKYCIGCDKCMKNVVKRQKELGMDPMGTWTPVPMQEYNCSIKDDMEVLHQKMLEADGFIVAAPVYMLSIPGQLKTFIDRCRTFAHDFRLMGKVGGVLTVAHFRHGGEEQAQQVMNNFCYTMFLNVVAYGAATISTKDGTGAAVRDTRFGVEKDTFGLYWVRQVGIRVATMAKIVKAGREVTGIV